MMNPFVALGVFCLEAVIWYIFCSNVFERRKSSFACLLYGVAYALIGTAWNLLIHNSGMYNTIATIIIQCAFACICFQVKLYISFFYSLILVVINGTAEVIVISTFSKILGVEFLSYNDNLMVLVMECSTCKSIYFFIVLIISRIAQPDQGKRKMPLILFLYPVTCSICLILFWQINILPGVDLDIQLRLSIVSVLHMVSTILLFITYQNQLEKESNTIQMQNEVARLQMEKSYYDILDQQNQQLMLYAHDAKNHLAAIQSLTEDPRIHQYIGTLSQQLANYTKNCHSGNKMLDVMIGKYSLACEQKGIRFHYDIKLCNLSVLEDMDLVAVLGNLMDNALTAAKVSQEKCISLATAKRNRYSVLVITNSCDVAPKTNAGQLVTSKPDSHLHGFGLTSVRKTLSKYHGDFEWSYDSEEKTFTVTTMIGQPS